MASLYLFTGANTYAVRDERRRWREQFVAKHGQENCSVLDGKHLALRAVLDEVAAAPFIAEKRLVIVDGVPKLTKEDVESIVAAQHPDCILLFVDPRPDKRQGGVKALLGSAAVKECLPLAGKALRDWMRSMVASHGSEMTADAMEELLQIVGEDQDLLWGELWKLALYASGRAVTVADVRLLAVPSGEQEIWQLTNLLAQGKRAEALQFAERLLAQGEDPFGLWSVLLWMLRSLVCVASAAAEGQRNPAQIASQFSLPFPTVKNLLGLAAKVHLAELEETVRWAAQADVDLKTGGLRATGEAPQELLSLIDLFVARSARLATR